MISSTVPTATFARQVYGFESTVIPHPLRIADFSVDIVSSAIPVIVFLGRLVPRKGALELLRAVDYMCANQLFDQPFKLIIGGKGELLPKLQTFVDQHGLGDKVTFAGFVAEADKAQFLAQADIALFPSISGESFGISLLEALAAAHGVVLGGDNPGYRAVLVPLSEDRLCLPLDTVKFAQQLASWLADPAARTKAAAAQKQYVADFDIDKIGEQVVEIYKRTLRMKQDVQ
jgi:phosphatidylinositol alpha-mannosyltransferase